VSTFWGTDQQQGGFLINKQNNILLLARRIGGALNYDLPAIGLEPEATSGRFPYGLPTSNNPQF